MRLYILNEAFEPGKHKILKVWSERWGIAKPEDNPRTAINVAYTVLEIDEDFNPVAWEIAKFGPKGKYYVTNGGDIYEVEGWTQEE